MDNELDAPLVPQPDWVDERKMIEIELELMGLQKIASSADALKEKRSREAGLLNAFKKDQTAETFTPLYQSYKPLIMKAAQKNMFGSPLPQAAHTAFAAQNFLDAIRTFDPKKGSSFNTHAFNTVFEKGKRLNLKYQNIGYIPESRAVKYQPYNTAMHLLREDLGREPSTLELADELGLPPKEIERLRKEIRTDYLASEHRIQAGMSFAQSDKAMETIRDLEYSLAPKHRLVLEYAYGMNGRQALIKKSGGIDVQGIAKAAKISVGDVRSAQKTISRKLREYRGTIGKKDDLAGLIEVDEAE